jgi:hypothetical protein
VPVGIAEQRVVTGLKDRVLFGFTDHLATPEDGQILARQALDWAKGLAAADGSKTVWIVTPAKADILHSPLDGTFDPKVLRRLYGHSIVRLPDDTFIWHSSARPNARQMAPRGHVLALLPDPQTLDRLHGWGDISTLVVLARTEEDVQQWADIRGAVFHVGNEVVPVSPRRLTSPAVRARVDALIRSQPNVTLIRDQAAAVDLFATLRWAEELVDLAALRAHVLRESTWRPDQVDELVALAKRMSAERPW